MLGWSIVITLILYLGALFGIAYKIDKSPVLGKRLFNSPTKYALSMAVYCTAWTFFGSVGAASTYSLEFLTIYIGPVVTIPFLWIIYRKFIRISKSQGISTISDFISIRYNKSIALNRLVTILLVLGIIPYISLQITGIEKAIETALNWENQSVHRVTSFGWIDIAFLITAGLGLFIILFTTRSFQNKEQNTGMIGAIALESIVKLVVFLIFGIYICYVVFDGQADLYSDIPVDGLKLNATNDYGQWFGMIFLSGIAFLFLPRQFEVGVIEAAQEKQLKKSIWLFPLYLLLINIFVIPIAIAGNRLLGDSGIDADTYMLAIPLQLNNPWMALLVLLGGFSAASGMIIVSTHALSKMVSNSILMPYFIGNAFILKRFKGKDHRIPVFFRRVSIVLVLLLAYSYYKLIVSDFSLISIGLISFLAVAQFAPSLFGAIFWKLGNRHGAAAGIVSGFVIWFLFLVLPTFLEEDLKNTFYNLLRKNNGDEGNLISIVLFWSMLINTFLYIVVSIFTKQTSLERNQAEIFVDIFKYSKTVESSVVWKGKAFFPDIQSLLARFLGEQRATYELAVFAKKIHISLDDKSELDPRVVNHAERLLSGFVGTSSARILVGSVAKEEKISMNDVVDILAESQKLISLNKELKSKSDELKRATDALKNANAKLKENDLLKDEFLYTVTHEMRTPLTSIKALSEILEDDDDDVPVETRKEFLKTIVKETDRMTRLISQVLDLENFESGKHQLVIEKVNFTELLAHCVNTLDEVFKRKNIVFQLEVGDDLPFVELDYDRITQVVLNLLANASNYCDKTSGEITLRVKQLDNKIKVDVQDNGPGVKPEMQEIIFEKFFQAKNQTIRKPKGSGLGLAISKKIIQLHEGKIWVDSSGNGGSTFSFTIPLTQNV